MQILFQTSLLASFIAGMVALFAPCCISFLLPAYLGSVFKEREKVLLATLVFGLGIFVVLMPAVLGISFVSYFLFRYHNTTYIFAALVMLLVSIISLLGIKIPLHLPGRNLNGRTDVFSIFLLGIFSGITSACCAPVLVGIFYGITSACCAPVLVGILALAFLSPSFWGALLIGAFYVLGMVFPLLLISLFLAGRIEKFAVLRKPLFDLSLFGRKYAVLVGNLIASIVFFLTGSLVLILVAQGKLSMARSEGFARTIQHTGEIVNSYFGRNPLIDILLVLVIIYLIYEITKKI